MMLRVKWGVTALLQAFLTENGPAPAAKPPTLARRARTQSTLHYERARGFVGPLARLESQAEAWPARANVGVLTPHVGTQT